MTLLFFACIRWAWSTVRKNQENELFDRNAHFLERTTNLQLPPKPRPTRKIPPPTITLKINKLLKSLPYQYHRHSFCAFPSPQKIKIPNKLNHLPHQLQGCQPPSVITRVIRWSPESPHGTSPAGFFVSVVLRVIRISPAIIAIRSGIPVHAGSATVPRPTPTFCVLKRPKKI